MKPCDHQWGEWQSVYGPVGLGWDVRGCKRAGCDAVEKRWTTQMIDPPKPTEVVFRPWKEGDKWA